MCTIIVSKIYFIILHINMFRPNMDRQIPTKINSTLTITKQDVLLLSKIEFLYKFLYLKKLFSRFGRYNKHKLDSGQNNTFMQFGL